MCTPQARRHAGNPSCHPGTCPFNHQGGASKAGMWTWNLCSLSLWPCTQFGAADLRQLWDLTVQELQHLREEGRVQKQAFLGPKAAADGTPCRTKTRTYHWSHVCYSMNSMSTYVCGCACCGYTGGCVWALDGSICTSSSLVFWLRRIGKQGGDQLGLPRSDKSLESTLQKFARKLCGLKVAV